ncbi:MAG TPA: DUF6526 family protein [Candidatus Angelobacter sp.]|jgi:hypothetical protein|nr:DUF6526 family protein [Candidatus Angelobacter sp.]
MEKEPQTYANHARLDPPFHFFVSLVFLLTVIIATVLFVRSFSPPVKMETLVIRGWNVIWSVAMVVAMTRIRTYPLRVQDRLIRLEERLRLMSVLQEPLRSRIGELEDAQLVALRFASDEELPALVKRALDERLSRDDIKKAIVKWRGDYSRV